MLSAVYLLKCIDEHSPKLRIHPIDDVEHYEIDNRNLGSVMFNLAKQGAALYIIAAR
jgi:hypothetical protein